MLSPKAISAFHDFDHDGKVVTWPAAALRDLLSVDGLIRIQPNDWGLALAFEESFWHFNSGVAPHRQESYYALVAILKPGLRSAEREVRPLLSPELLVRAKVEEVQTFTSLQAFQGWDFSTCLLQERSMEGLAQAIKGWYAIADAATLEARVKEEGVSATRLKPLCRLKLSLPVELT